MTELPANATVCNTTVLSNFAQVDRVELLLDLPRLVTDDGDARTTAKRRGVDVTGSIGLLVRFVEDDQISAETADRYLKRWIDEAGFRSPARDFDVFL